MLKLPVTYEDFNGETQTETLYFNLSKSELIELEVGVEGGFAKMLDNIVKSENQKELVAQFKKLILLAYGVKSEDGKRFIKSDQLREEFSQTAAYNELFMKFATDDKAAADFVNGIIPKDMVEEVAKEQQKANRPSTAEIAATIQNKENDNA